ncbi:unnamed protein product [Phyllotreta striolata]|uniref:MD-2-related lipid-recognition domain-containing protein n=1 Tax=Phyllotreta striolata TaxID=444603 RepID=A0A9N9TSM8_PHYSR|nr:unnamed protein product [Phyllotreta striolata]
MLVLGIIILLSCFDNSLSDVLDFRDCGDADYMPVESLIFNDCEIAPCMIDLNQKSHTSLKLEVSKTVPQFSSMVATAEIIQAGFSWKLKISPSNPCDRWKCPLQPKKHHHEFFNTTIDFSPIKWKNPGRVRIEGKVNNIESPIFCMEVTVRFF